MACQDIYIFEKQHSFVSAIKVIDQLARLCRFSPSGSKAAIIELNQQVGTGNRYLKS